MYITCHPVNKMGTLANYGEVFSNQPRVKIMMSQEKSGNVPIPGKRDGTWLMSWFDKDKYLGTGH